jgi:hypothetical protein
MKSWKKVKDKLGNDTSENFLLPCSKKKIARKR